MFIAPSSLHLPTWNMAKEKEIEIEILHWRREQEFTDLCAELTENTVLRRCRSCLGTPALVLALFAVKR